MSDNRDGGLGGDFFLKSIFFIERTRILWSQSLLLLLKSLFSVDKIGEEPKSIKSCEDQFFSICYIYEFVICFISLN